MPASDRVPFSLESIVVGRNPRIRAIFRYLALVGPGMGTMLVTGERGTGKEVVANALHLYSPRRDRPFIAVRCALFSEEVIASALFGHEPDTMAGALAGRAGEFERADGGTIFLDDIDDVPLSVQVTLLHVLQQRTIARLGGARAVPVDVRVVAGTTRDLPHLVREGRFREDLYYRLNVLSVRLPPLRERREDIPLLVTHFLERSFARRGVPPVALPDTVMQALLSHDWPGNVRELEQRCERIAESGTCGRGPDLTSGCPSAPEAGAGPASPASHERIYSVHADGLSLDQYLRRVEAECIASALAASGGNKSRAARLLGIKRSTLGDRIVRCGREERVT